MSSNPTNQERPIIERKWFGLFHRHEWSRWWLGDVEGGNMLGHRYEKQCRYRRCQTCLKTQIRNLGK